MRITRYLGHLQVKKRIESISVEPGGAIILLTVSYGYLDFFANWVVAAGRIGIQQFLVIAEDLAVYEAMTHWPQIGAAQVILAPTPIKPAAAQQYNSTGYRAIVERRPQFLRAVLAAGRPVIYTDVDTVWFSSPLDEMRGNYDVYMPSDIDNPYDEPAGMLCTGLMFLRPTPAVAALLLDWEVALESAVSGRFEAGLRDMNFVRNTNQPTFNRVLLDTRRQHNLSMKVLDVRKFPSGSVLFGEFPARAPSISAPLDLVRAHSPLSIDHFRVTCSYYRTHPDAKCWPGHPRWIARQSVHPVVAHSNYLIGADAKRDMLIKHGLWFV